jgi:hypothetical protein
VKFPAVLKTSVPDVYLVGTERVDLADIRRGIVDLRNSIVVDLDFLKEGMIFNASGVSVVDDLSNNVHGYQFTIGKNVTDDRTYRSLLLMHFLQSPHLAAKYFMTCADDVLLPPLNIDAAKRWLARYDELQKKLLLLIHVCSGMPARYAFE